MSLSPKLPPVPGGELSLSSRSRLLVWFLDAPLWQVIALALVLTAAICGLDALVYEQISVGVLFTAPMLIFGLRVSRTQVVLVAALDAALRESFTPSAWQSGFEQRIFYGFLSFVCAGMFANEVARGRARSVQYLRELQEHIDRRKEVESQLQTLIESSPAAIITLDSSGRVEMANNAAHELLAVPQGSLPGASIAEYLPVMVDVLQSAGNDAPYRTATNCRGRRANGESFLACVWFATYPTRSGQRLAAILADASEDLRDWQETSLQSLLRSTRVLVGSVSHEIRNVCAAISVVHANLGRIEGVAQTEDYAALGTLAQGLSRLATVELQAPGEQEIGRVNLENLLEEFRIVVSPTVESESLDLRIELEPDLPAVYGDHHGLLQVLLNLFRNSVRAIGGRQERRLFVEARLIGDAVLLRLTDSGDGVAHPERLFQPFQQGADAVGLGLFVSRAIVRACDGELYHEPSHSGCTMCFRLKPYFAGDYALDPQNTEISA
jgi:signal transduction histidine kinase